MTNFTVRGERDYALVMGALGAYADGMQPEAETRSTFDWFYNRAEATITQAGSSPSRANSTGDQRLEWHLEVSGNARHDATQGA